MTQEGEQLCGKRCVDYYYFDTAASCVGETETETELQQKGLEWNQGWFTVDRQDAILGPCVWWA